MTAKRLFDVDLDVKSSTEKEKYGVRAVVYNEETERIIPHPSGYYLQKVPVDELTGNCAFDSKYGEKQGFMKVDLLTNTSFDRFNTKEELLMAVNTEPDWNMLQDESYVKTLPHLSKHYETIRKLQPRSIEDLSDVLALIRPGKIHLFDQYLEDKERTRLNLYKKPTNGMAYFKKSHAIGYAVMIVALMNKENNRSLFGWS